MMGRQGLVLSAAAAAIASAVPLAGVLAAPIEAPALNRLNDGQWELRERDGFTRRICIGGLDRLIQLKHRDLPCSRLILENSPASLTVQYTCRGRGYGRTHIRRESSDLIQIESQGIAEGLPFEFAAEGRRVGLCVP